MDANTFTILDSLNEGILILDQIYTIVHANKVAIKLYGSEGGEVVGRKCHEVFHGRLLPCGQKDHGGEDRCACREVFESGQSVMLKHRHVLPDGSARIFEISASPLKDEHGRVSRSVLIMRNITMEEKLKGELAASHQTLEMIFANAPFTITFIDREMRVIRLNSAMETLIGMKTEMVQGKHCYECWGQYAHDETRRGREKVCDKCQALPALLKGQRHSYERLLGDRFFEIITTPVRDASGVIIGVMEMGNDITERHRDRVALQQSEQRFHAILDQASDAIFVHDFDGRFLEVNRQACDSLGYTREELLQLSVNDVNPGISRKNPKENFWKNLSAKDTFVIESSHRRKDGSFFPIEIHIGALEYDNQPVVLGIARDTSGREKAQKALQENINNYRALFENSPTVICVADVSGIQEYLVGLPSEATADYEAFFRNNPSELAACLSRLRIFEVNQAALRLFVAASIQEVTTGLFTIFGQESRPYSIGGLEAIARGETFFEHDIFLHDLTGAEIYGILHWSVVPGYEKNYNRVILSIVDLTARKKAEDHLACHREQLQRLSHRLVETEELERRYIARELHDKLGQHLAALGINLNILESKALVGQDSESARRFSDSVELIEEMTQQVRDIMADLRPPVLDDYGLSAALRWYGDIVSKRTTIQVEVTGVVLPRFSPILEMALFRVVQEALTNVVKHSGATEAEVYCLAQGGRILLEINDNGKGFAEDVPSSQGETPRLGLVSMRERLQAFGGRLTVDSSPASGARIIVEVEV
ncbi:MAG: PAS domain S-box protein [Deltaproteobacteria bacterium]|nr:PAS domain S-box protein [Deltaproteobacteria bacterium]